MSTFDDHTAVRARGDGVFDVDLHPSWAINGKPNGGYTLSMLGRAACEAVGTTHPLAISGHYLRAPSSGPAEIRTEVVRQGRRVSTSRATIWQNDKPCIDALITSGELVESSEVEWAKPMPTDMPAPEDCFSSDDGKFQPELFTNIEMRSDPTTSPFPQATGEPRIRYWFRFKDDAQPSVPSLILAVDAGPPTVFNLKKFGWAPTVELTVLLRAIPAPGWLLCESSTRSVDGPWFDEDAVVWDSTGRVVAQSRQLALIGEPTTKSE